MHLARAALVLVACVALAAGCNSGSRRRSGAAAPPPAPAAGGPTRVDVAPLGSLLGPTDVVDLTFDAAVLATSVLASVAVTDSAAGVAAPATGTVAALGSTVARFEASGPWRLDGEVRLVVGTGVTGAGGLALPSTSNTTWRTASTSSVTTNQLVGGSTGTATTLRDGRVLLVGGRDQERRAVLWDPATGAFTATGELRDGRLGHAARLLPDGRVAVFGGQSSASNAMRPTVEAWDPATGAWTVTTEALAPRTITHAVERLPDGRWLVVGGYHQVAFPSPVQTAVNVLSADLAAVTTSAATVTQAGPGVLLETGDLAVFGNLGNQSTPSTSVTVVRVASAQADPVAGVVVLANALVAAGSDPSACRLPGDGRVLVQRGADLSVVTITYAGGAPQGASAVPGPTLAPERARTFAQLLPLADGAVWIGPGGRTTSVTEPVADLFVPDAAGPGRLVALTAATGRRSYAAALLRDGRVVAAAGRSGALAGGTAQPNVEVFSHEALAQGSLGPQRRTVLVAAVPRPGWGELSAATDRRFRLVASGSLDPASVVPGVVVARVNGQALAGAQAASVTLVDRRTLEVELPAAVALAAGDRLELVVDPALRDVTGLGVDATRGVARSSWTIARP